MSTAQAAPRAHKHTIAYVAIGVGIAAVVAGFLARDEIVFNARLLYATFVANQFYNSSPNITKNIAFSANPNLTLDVYQPTAPGPHPVLIWVYGGSWSSGSKELYAPVAQMLLPQNFVIVIPNYTLFDANKPRSADAPIAFQQAQQVADAFVWTRENIARFGGDPAQIVWGGHSAGAQLTGLATFDPKYLETRGHSPQEICGWYGISGPYDINAQLAYEMNVKGNKGELLYGVFGTRDGMNAASPSAYIKANVPPTLLIHGSADQTVPLATSENFQNALQSAGARSNLKIYDGAGHSGILFDALAEPKPRLLQDLANFAAQCKPK